MNKEVRMNTLPNIHPGEILEEEFLKGFGISAYRLAKEINIPATRISQIIKGRRRITADTALRFSRYFGTTPEFWLNLQTEYDLRKEKKRIQRELQDMPTVHSV
jgi:addiction module HigA family antidote